MLSIYLDVVRFGAAVVVVLHHAWPLAFPRHPVPWPGHEAVVLFFVLSGLVISHATNRPGMSARDYVLHRVARIWSVALPGLALSAAVSIAVGGAGLGEAGWPINGWRDGAISVLANVFNIAQLWQLDIDPPLNAPYWSINFEVWYYVLFGAWIFLQGRNRAAAIAVIALIVGPKILLLLPVWLLGVAVYHYRPQFSEGVACLVWVLTCVAGLAFIRYGLSIGIRGKMIAAAPSIMLALGGANQFVGDWLMALIVGLNFTAAASLGRFGSLLIRLERPIRAAAGSTFSAYLYHMPLFALAYLVFGLRGWPALLMVGIAILALAQVTERQLPLVRRWLASLTSGSARA